jgi:hypothetical protein
MLAKLHKKSQIQFITEKRGGGGETKREKERELMENLQELTGSLGSLANCDLEEGRHHTLLIIRR